GGWACLPLTVPGAKAASPPGPLRRGRRAMPPPVPCDSAEVLFPAMGSLPCFWILFDCKARTARFMTSGLNGVAKTGGSSIFPVAFPSRFRTFATLFTISSHLSSSLWRLERNVSDLRWFFSDVSWWASRKTQSYWTFLSAGYASLKYDV